MAYRLSILRSAQLNKCTSMPPIRSLASKSSTIQFQSYLISPLNKTTPSFVRSYHATTISTDQESEKSLDPNEKIPEEVEEVFQKILALDAIEVHLLQNLINEKLGITVSERDLAGGSGGGGGSDAASENKAEEEEEKTAFELKLIGFDAKAKIKVIKEVRTIAALGLKEAKEMVEGAPKVVKKDIKKEEAEELKAKLEAVGATVEIV